MSLFFSFPFPAKVLRFFPEYSLLDWQTKTTSEQLEQEILQFDFQNIEPADFMKQLRLFRQKMTVKIYYGEFEKWWDTQQTMLLMTFLADYLTQKTVIYAMEEMIKRYGTPTNKEGIPQDFRVIAMGKQGGGELNLSSDIDLIFCYPENGETIHNADELAKNPKLKTTDNQHFFSEVGKRVIKYLSEITEHGFVFRVDMRLRPNGDSGPLVGSFQSLEHYFLTQGRDWERYAWIKSRMLEHHFLESESQNNEYQQRYNQIVKQFVYRKYLDFGAIDALRKLNLQIRQELGKKFAFHPRHHVKLGRGGIRELEFLIHVFQLIRGGKQPNMQIRPTLAVLRQFGHEWVLNKEYAQSLENAYLFLRQVEHALQFLEDQQTHLLPEPDNTTAQNQVCYLLHIQDWQTLLQELQMHQDLIQAAFDDLFVQDQLTLIPALENLILTQKEQLQDAIRPLIYELDRLIEPISTPETEELSDEKQQKLMSWCDFFKQLNRKQGYLALFKEYPKTLEQVLKIQNFGKWGYDYLIKHPIVLDELLDPRNDNQIYTQKYDIQKQYYEELIHQEVFQYYQIHQSYQACNEEEVIEKQMNQLRESYHAQVFRILWADVQQKITILEVADSLSALIDGLVESLVKYLIPLVLEQHKNRKTEQENWKKLYQKCNENITFTVIAYGKLGAKELGYGSDLDLVFLYDDAELGHQTFYQKLAQQLIKWLSLETPTGNIAELDTRLRPDGALLVSSLNRFTEYQQQKAHLWEHQALTRARAIAGHTGLKSAFESLRHLILLQKREKEHVATEIVEMREKMKEHHHKKYRIKSDSFDLKYSKGGMIDIEFMVQYIVLVFSHQYPQLIANTGTVHLLKLAAQLGLLPAGLALNSSGVYAQLRLLQHHRRLNHAEFIALNDDEMALIHHANSSQKLWEILFETI